MFAALPPSLQDLLTNTGYSSAKDRVQSTTNELGKGDSDNEYVSSRKKTNKEKSRAKREKEKERQSVAKEKERLEQLRSERYNNEVSVSKCHICR